MAASSASSAEGAAGRGDDHMLTVDLGLQQYVAARFGEESGSAVVLDVHSGEILALASMPSYDPNLFTSGISEKQWRELINHPRFPLSNKSIAGQYSPGSTFKMIVALAALESGEVSPYHRFYCNGSLKLGKRRFRCWRRYGHGHVAMVQGLMEIVRCLLLRAVQARRHRSHRRDGGAVRFRQENERRAAWGEARPGADPRVEARRDRRALAGRRDPGDRYRPGLPADHAAPARGDGGAHRQRRHRGRAPHPGGGHPRWAAACAGDRDVPADGDFACPISTSSARACNWL